MGLAYLGETFFSKYVTKCMLNLSFLVTMVVVLLVMSIFCYFIASVYLTLAGVIKNHF